MNGKDIMLGLGYIEQKYIEEAFPRARLRTRKRPLLIAAIVALMLMLVGCGAVIAQGWLGQYFEQKSGVPLTPEQEAYIAENEQIIGESQVQDQWTVELRSAIHDGSKAIIIIGVAAPEGVSLEPKIEEDSMVEWVSPGNGGRGAAEPGVIPVVTDPKGVCTNVSSHWEEDGDCLSNTKNYVLELEPFPPLCTADPFGPDAEYRIHIENIVRESDDEEYKQSLLNGKYAGQTDVMFESDEVARMWKREILAEGTWDFTVRFAESGKEVELLSQPITVMGYAYREGPPLNEFLNSTVESYEEIKLTSFVLRSLSATLTYECDADCNFAIHEEDHIYAVMKDGSRIELEDQGYGDTLEAVSPIVIENVDHILMADGTKIPMP